MPNEEQGQDVLAPVASVGATSLSQPLVLAAISDRGRSRSTNQDYAYAGALPGAPGWTLLAVADGLGGHARGEWASQRAIELLASSLGATLMEASHNPGAALSATISAINQAVHFEARGISAAGAATTLVVALIHGREAWWANVGDSRLYRWSCGALSQVSADHSWVAEQVRSGRLPATAMHDHPEKNVVTRTIGFEASVSPDWGGPLFLAEGETLLLCSDGLHGPVSEAGMSRCLGELGTNLAAQRMVELANEAGGPDNVTVVLGHFGGIAARPEATQLTEPGSLEQPRKKRRWRRWRVSGVAALLAGALGAVPIAFFYFV